jgi:thioredoxin reductase
MNTYDVVIVGGGAAGLSAALVLTRARRAVAVVDSGQPRNAPASHMHGFLSRDGLPPSDLLTIGRDEVTGYGGHLIDRSVERIQRTTNGFEVLLVDGPPMTTRHVVVATGLRDELPDIDGVAQRWGRDLLHCPYCHGYEVRDQRLAVIGGSPESVQHAQLVRQWSRDVVLFSHVDQIDPRAREEMTARGIGIVDGRVKRLVVSDDHLTGIELDDGRVVPRDAAFVRPQFTPNSKLLLELGCVADDNGWVTTDATGRTSEPGVWAVGNVSNARAQVITAAGDGSATAIALNAALVDEDVRAAFHRKVLT